MSRNNLGPDPSQWSNGQMTSVGGAIAGGLAMAVTASLVRAANANKRPRRVLSAKAIRENAERIHVLEMNVMSALLKHRMDQNVELQAKLAKSDEALAQERYLRSRGL